MRAALAVQFGLVKARRRDNYSPPAAFAPIHLTTNQPTIRVRASPTGATDGAAVDPGLEVRVAAAANANVLVAMAARESAMHRYGNALYCLRRAVEMDPGNVG